MFHTKKITQEHKETAQQLLLLTPNVLYIYWEAKIAVDYNHGLYLKAASDRNKKGAFSKWKKELSTIAVAEVV